MSYVIITITNHLVNDIVYKQSTKYLVILDKNLLMIIVLLVILICRFILCMDGFQVY